LHLNALHDVAAAAAAAAAAYPPTAVVAKAALRHTHAHTRLDKLDAPLARYVNIARTRGRWSKRKLSAPPLS